MPWISPARRFYGQAVQAFGKRVQDLAVMRNQARLNLRALNQPENALDDVFPIPAVAVFAGHMVDSPDRLLPRFPSGWMPWVSEQIRERVRSLGVGYGFCSAARGSDLAFIQAVLDQQGYVTVYLPFPQEVFAQTSVGRDWHDEFYEVLEHPRVEVKVLSQDIVPESEQPEAFFSCNKKLQKAAIAQAKHLDTAPVMLAVWDGLEGDGKGGTADAVASWKARGGRVDRIPLQQE